MRKILVSVLSLCLPLAAAMRCLAQNGPDNDPDGLPGYVDNVFHHGSVDSINLYNGQLTIPIALGPSYPVGPKLRVQAALTYNSRVWEYGHPAAQDPFFTTTPISGDPALGIGWGFTFERSRPARTRASSVRTAAGTSSRLPSARPISERRMRARCISARCPAVAVTRCGTRTGTATISRGRSPASTTSSKSRWARASPAISGAAATAGTRRR